MLERLESGARFERNVGVDAAGAPTGDPAAILQGGILPMGGGIKGTLLNLLLGTLAGPLAGGEPNQNVLGTRWPDARPNKTDFFLCLDVAAFGEPETFAARMTSLLEEMTGTCPDFHVSGQHSRGPTSTTRPAASAATSCAGSWWSGAGPGCPA